MHNLKLLLLLILVAVTGTVFLGQEGIIGFFHLTSLENKPIPTSTSEKTIPTPINSYGPTDYGLPSTIAGYKVLAVLTAENNACMMPEQKRLVLQASQTDMDDYLKDSNPNAINTALEQNGLTASDWEIQVVGPTVTLDEILDQVQIWNKQMENGCVRSGPAVILGTPAK